MVENVLQVRWSKLLVNNKTLGMIINLLSISLLVSSLLGCQGMRKDDDVEDEVEVGD